MEDAPAHTQALRIAEAVREACVREAKAGFEQAAISGLCHEGAVESAIGAIQMLDLEALLRELGSA
ncbi:MAG TPA: acetyltransferase [Gammaproteobacteria bacterium]|nr:acetyltransferase [Gammaproteobacteria bacterium]